MTTVIATRRRRRIHALPCQVPVIRDGELKHCDQGAIGMGKDAIMRCAEHDGGGCQPLGVRQ